MEQLELEEHHKLSCLNEFLPSSAVCDPPLLCNALQICNKSIFGLPGQNNKRKQRLPEDCWRTTRLSQLVTFLATCVVSPRQKLSGCVDMLFPHHPGT